MYYMWQGMYIVVENTVQTADILDLKIICARIKGQLQLMGGPTAGNGSNPIENDKSLPPSIPLMSSQLDSILQVVRADNFDVHYRRHTGEKPYKCPFCPFRSANRSSMPKHLKLHECGRVPQYCAHCRYSTASKANLVAHYQTYHKPLQSTGR